MLPWANILTGIVIDPCFIYHERERDSCLCLYCYNLKEGGGRETPTQRSMFINYYYYHNNHYDHSPSERVIFSVSLLHSKFNSVNVLTL